MASIIEVAAQRMNEARRGAPPDVPPKVADFTATVPRRLAAPVPDLGGDTRRPVMLRPERESPPFSPPAPARPPAAPAGAPCDSTCAGAPHASARVAGGMLWRVALMAATVGAGLMYSAMTLIAPATNPRSPGGGPRIAASPAAASPAAAQPARAAALVAAPVHPSSDAHEDARQFVMAWARAWSAADVEGYLAHYAPDFAPGNGLTHAQWQAQRRKRIATARTPEVAIRDLTFEAAGEGRLMARFRQDYRAGSYREMDTPKSLTLVKGAGGWRIAAEAAG